MPIGDFKIRKVRGKECYQVKSITSGKIHAECTTKQKAEAQVRILNKLYN